MIWIEDKRSCCFSDIGWVGVRVLEENVAWVQWMDIPYFYFYYLSRVFWFLRATVTHFFLAYHNGSWLGAQSGTCIDEEAF